jgi:hypothetical protein
MPVVVEAACVSILGGIQPGPLYAYLQETFVAGGDDGLIQRFQRMRRTRTSAFQAPSTAWASAWMRWCR